LTSQRTNVCAVAVEIVSRQLMADLAQFACSKSATLDRNYLSCHRPRVRVETSTSNIDQLSSKFIRIKYSKRQTAAT